MAISVPLTLREANDETIKVTVTTNDPAPDTVLNLTGKTIEAFVKVNAAALDTDPGTWKGSTTTGEVVITDAAAGNLSINVPGVAVTTTKGWWRCDVLTGGLRKTSHYGPLTVIDL